MTDTSRRLRLQSVGGRAVRASPAYRLVEYGHLAPEEAAAFAELAEAEDQYGLLIPRDKPTLGILAADAISASLFRTLERPGRLPADLSPDRAGIAGLVLDGVLEVEWAGGFVSGPAACPALLACPPQAPEPADCLSALSFDALRLAQDLPITDPKALSRWIYNYHRLPVSPVWANRLPDQRHLEKALGLQRGAELRQLLDDVFVPHDVPGWRAWHSPGEDIVGPGDQPTYKLYVSPHPSALSEAFPAIVRCLAEMRVPAFKLGRDVFGVLRPDKLVVYLNGYRELENLAGALRRVLHDCPAHGVPFTAALTADGLLSWGMDPPRSEQIPGWRDVESWRLWVANHLARTLLRSRALGGGDRHLPPWQFALLRLELNGVNVENWTPTSALWSIDGAGT